MVSHMLFWSYGLLYVDLQLNIWGAHHLHMCLLAFVILGPFFKWRQCHVLSHVLCSTAHACVPEGASLTHGSGGIDPWHCFFGERGKLMHELPVLHSGT